MNFGHLDPGNIVDEAIVADQQFVDTLPNAADWMELPYGVGIGWEWTGSAWLGTEGQSPPIEPVSYRTLLLGPEWVATFTDDEWAWLKTQRVLTTAAGKGLDKMMDAIRWTNSVDVASENMDVFYNWLLNNSIPGGQTRIDELREGLPE